MLSQAEPNGALNRFVFRAKPPSRQGLPPDLRQVVYTEVRSTQTRLVDGAVLPGPYMVFADLVSRSRGDFFTQSCLPTCVGLGLQSGGRLKGFHPMS